MFTRACAPRAASCGRRREGAEKPKPEWADSFEKFRRERAELTAEEAEREWEAQRDVMLQEEEVATRLYAEMDVLEGPGGGRAAGAASESAASASVRMASPREADVRAAQEADRNPFAVDRKRA